MKRPIRAALLVALLAAIAPAAAQASEMRIETVTPASVAIVSERTRILVDPVGPQSRYRPFGRPDIVILTRAHPDHLSIDTMIGLLRRDTVVLAPQSVIDSLPLMISNNVITPFAEGSTQEVDGISFTALAPGAAIPDGAEAPARTRGDLGVLMEVDGRRLYF